MQHSSEKVLESAYRRSPAIVQAMLPTAYAYMYLYLARLSLTSGNTTKARNFVEQAWAADRSLIGIRDRC